MSCYYEYNGKRFDSEVKLNDFLLEKEKYLSKYGDLVFEKTSAFLHTKEQIDNLISESKSTKELLDKSKKTYYDGEYSYNPNPPYTGVNAFLNKLRNSDNELWFPYFDEENYWNKRYEDWNRGEFTDDEKQMFFDNPDDVRALNQSEYNTYRSMVEERWKTQAEYGETIHSIFQLFFSKIKSGTNVGKLVSSMSDSFLENVYFPKLLDMNTINKSSIKDAIKIAREFKAQLESKFGKDLEYYPEVSIMGDSIQEVEGKGNKVLGRIDLLVMDSNGNVHIVDYKTSPKPFYNSISEKGYSSAKIRAIYYQLALYNRILDRYGINVNNGDIMIVPMQMKNFRKEGDKYVYDGISPIKEGSTNESGERIPPVIWHSIKNKIETSFTIQRNLSEYFPVNNQPNITSEELGSKVSETMSKLFTSYRTNNLSDEEIISNLKDKNAFEPKDGFYYYQIGKKEFVVPVEKGESELVKQVKDYYNLVETFKLKLTSNIQNSLQKAISSGDPNMDLPKISKGQEYVDSDWLSNMLHKYINGNWKIIENQSLSNYGLILLQNQITGQIDIKRITYKELGNIKHLDNKDGTLLSSNFISDSIEKSDSNSLMLESRVGNIELMETMLILNNLQNLFKKGSFLGSVEILSPYHGKGITASNEELIYSLNKLLKLNKLPVSKFNREIKVCSKYQLMLDEFKDIMTTGKRLSWQGEYYEFAKFESCISDLDKTRDSSIQEKIDSLEKFIKQLENNEKWTKSLQSVETSQDKLIQNYRRLYDAAQIALADLNGINFKQQIIDGNNFLKSINILKNGFQGNYLDNPGNLGDTLNVITKQTTIAYQNVRDSMREPVYKFNLLLNKLKGKRSTSLFGNRVNLYENLYEDPGKTGGDFRFKNLNDPTLIKEERDLLQYVLRLINKNRRGLSDKQCQIEEDNNTAEYYRVPLLRGGEESRVNVDGLLFTLKNKLKSLSPLRIQEDFSNKMQGIGYAEENDQLLKANSDLFQMQTMFDWGETSDRQNIINKIVSENGYGYFEHNLETIALKHYFSYSMKNNINKVFPIMKAALAHLAYQGFVSNKYFKNDIDYVEKYIRNKIKNESIIPKNYQVASEYINKVKTAASYMVLAFSPVQALYQGLQGIWNDIRLYFTKPDIVGKYGTTAFTFKNLQESFRSAYKDIFNFSDKKSVNTLINELYGLNDMDINQYVERIQNQPKGLFNFNRIAMTFSSRPDYYNRLTMFGAQMRKDGCWDAHYVKDNKLIYDWTKDKRFELFANDRNVGSDEYNYQRALYYEMCKQFVQEGIKNADGTLFTYSLNKKVALPRAYTSKQAESFKSLADDIYGYYSHEKKAMWQSTMLGSMFMQFKTYWSGKKNQYFGAKGVKMVGDFIQITDNDGKLLFYKTDEYGNVTDEITTEKTDYPVIKWTGKYQEGIALTLASAMDWNPAAVFKNIKNQWYSDNVQLRQAYRKNYTQLTYDVILWMIVGHFIGYSLSMLLDDLKKSLKDQDTNDISDSLKLYGATVAVNSVRSSFLDFNLYDSAINPMLDWNPFAIDYTIRTAKRLWKTITFKQDVSDFLLKSMSFTNQMKPAIDLLKSDEE